MKQVTMIQCGEGKDAKFFLTKEEAQAHELGTVMDGILNKAGINTTDTSASSNVSTLMLAHKDIIVSVLLAKRKRKAKTTTPPKTTKTKKGETSEPNLV